MRALQKQHPKIRLGEMPQGANIVIDAWNLMGGDIDWSGVPLIAELFGFDDLEWLVRQFAAIRDHLNRVRQAEADAKR